MATNIPPHNLGELIDACCALIDNPELTVPQLMEYVPGPDFPTGGTILGRNGIRAGYELGRGSLIMRAKTRIEEARGGRESIIVSEIPYQENKARLHERIAEVVRDKRVEGIAEVRDESDRDGVRLVIELKRDAMADVVLNQLYRFTPLQTTFGINALALDGGRPRLMSLKEFLEAFIRFRAEVITRRTKYELNHARDRAHVLVGLAIAVANIDEVIEMIRRAPDPVVARERLMARAWPAFDVAPLIALIAEPGREVATDGTYRLSEAQARAILELRLQRLTGLERDKIAEELTEVAKLIEGYLELLGDRDKLFALMRTELVEIKEQVRHAAPHRDPRQRVRAGHRGSDPARGHGRHGDARRLRQARAGVGLSRPAPRRQGPLRHGHARGRFRLAACSSPTRTRRCCSSRAAASSTSSRSGACRSARRRRAARRSSTCCRWARARRSAPSCRCRRTRRAGRRSM